MATTEFIPHPQGALLPAVDTLNARLNAAADIAEALDLAGGENPPAWAHVLRSQVEAIREASDQLETLIRQGAAS
ncbi:MAG: hypothetical protein V4639_01785 [Pseudomonadota bacterium]